AQTISYGLLTARFSRPAGISVQNLVDMVPPTNPFLRELLGEFLVVAGRKKGMFDFDELGIQDVVELLNRANAEAVKSDFGNRTSNEDPIIHFYEHFLAAYDKKKKIQRGVFFTPQPVVSYIVRSVHELLQTEFALEDGLADTTTWGEMAKRNKGLGIPDGAKPDDPFVLILDPATGTATFLVEAIDLIHKTLVAKWKAQGHGEKKIEALWNEYVPKHLLPRLHGYELLMAPYAIAHLKVGLKLDETGYRFGSDERARIYLTNTLEPASDMAQLKLEGFLPALAHEAQAVNQVKRQKRFTVVIGNPPYSGVSSNMTEYAQALVDAFKMVDGRPLNERKHWLQDDYVKFFRISQLALQETGAGVLGVITNHAFLDNPTFRGMRQSLLETFSSGHICDLHGSTKKSDLVPTGISDENVFDIQQGVAITIDTKRPGGSRGFRYAHLWGPREDKYALLGSSAVGQMEWSSIRPETPYYFFIPKNLDFLAEYQAGWPITGVMPTYVNGIVT
ncbi:MAG: DNA methyltransferase, partial [Chloroflexi bacterium]|nr:DNA methyltransferase [Chloroflexota bacterium]